MILPLFRRTAPAASIDALYGTIVAQARAPAFYRSYEVPDTVNGRFEMLVLHLVLILRRLQREPKPSRHLGQEVFNRFCSDMDGSLREMGVGDLSVPLKMRKIGEAYYGRQTTYAAALGVADAEPLASALARTVFGSDPDVPPGARRLAIYARTAIRHLDGLPGDAIDRAEFAFPNPETITAANQA